MSVTGSLLFDEICQRGSVHEADVAKLREQFYEDGRIAGTEADALFEINHACRIQDPAWLGFFIEATSDYIVGHAEPRGYINVDNADWLIERIAQDGVLETHTELEILISVIDKARWSPESLVRFALNAVKDAVISGNGTLRNGQSLIAGEVTDSDVELLRRIVFAFGGDGNVAVTRAEAEILFEINDATAGATHCTAWTEFFVKAMSGVVMAASGYRAPPRAEALRREQWLETRGELSPGNLFQSMHDAGLSGFDSSGDMSPKKLMRAMYDGGLSGFLAQFTKEDDEDWELQRLEKQRCAIITNEDVTGDEANWLAAQINRDGELSFNERCLLAHLRAESPQLHPALQPLLDKVSAST